MIIWNNKRYHTYQSIFPCFNWRWVFFHRFFKNLLEFCTQNTKRSLLKQTARFFFLSLKVLAAWKLLALNWTTFLRWRIIFEVNYKQFFEIFMLVIYKLLIINCLLKDKKSAQKVWTNDLVYKKTFMLPSHTQLIQYNFLCMIKFNVLFLEWIYILFKTLFLFIKN